MTDFLTITEFISDNKNNLTFVIIVLAGCLIASVIFGIYRDKLAGTVLHPRNVWHFIWCIASAVGIYILSGMAGVPLIMLGIDVILWLLYLAAVVLSVNPGISKIHPILRKYAQRLEGGLVTESEEFFKAKSRWYFIDRDEKIAYAFLRCRYFNAIGDFESTYKCIADLDVKYLSTKEYDEYIRFKTVSLIMMGNMKAAREMLGSPEQNTSTDPYIWISYSYIAENNGDIDTAFVYAQKARSLMEAGSFSDWQCAQILNDYARVALFRGNRDEARHYYGIAFEKIKDRANTKLLHTVAYNYIMRTAIDTGDRTETERILTEYKERIRFDTLSNRTEYSNCCILLYRQWHDYQKEFKTIRDDFLEIYPKLPENKREIFKASTFRMVMNGEYVHDWFDEYIRTDIRDYSALSDYERLCVFKEYMGIFVQIKFRVLYQREPYRSLYNMIMNFYSTEGVKVVDSLLARTENYNIYAYKSLIEHKLFILMILEKEKHIDRSMSLYFSLQSTLDDAGLRIEALNSRMLFIDHCASEYNLMLKTPMQDKPVWYGDFLNQIPPPPEPLLHEDQIHLKYYTVNIASDFEAIPTKKELISENLTKAIADWDSFSEHPVKLDVGIHIAHFLICFDRLQEARRFYDYYKKSELTKEHFSSWMREELMILEKMFEDKEDV